MDFQNPSRMVLVVVEAAFAAAAADEGEMKAFSWVADRDVAEPS